MEKIVVLTGAGMSAESGIRTFRDMGGLWKEYDIMEVASPSGWQKHPDVVLDFYNQRRKQLLACQPNEGHFILAELEKYFDLHIITQNVDDLHERAGSSNILHLHGELRKVRSTGDSDLIYDLKGWELKLGDTCEKGYQLRPHIVWFGEPVPNIYKAEKICRTADIFIIVGTSLNVYPAAGLMYFIPSEIPIYYIDPKPASVPEYINIIPQKASSGLKTVKDILLKKKQK